MLVSNNNNYSKFTHIPINCSKLLNSKRNIYKTSEGEQSTGAFPCLEYCLILGN